MRLQCFQLRDELIQFKEKINKTILSILTSTVGGETIHLNNEILFCTDEDGFEKMIFAVKRGYSKESAMVYITKSGPEEIFSAPIYNLDISLQLSILAEIEHGNYQKENDILAIQEHN